MKKTFVFDKSENDILDIDESTVNKETGINAARVKESVMKEIKSGKKAKKFSAKKIFSIVAVAAAITAAATVTVQAATGVFNPAFGEIFSGQPANGVFPGSDISVKSDTLDIEFVGVTGDETNMFSVYNITRKDGSNFVDTTDNYCFLGTNAQMDVSESAFKKLKLMMDGGRGVGDGVTYEFVDAKTIRAMAVFSDTAGCIKGERLTVTDTETSFYHIDEVLYSDKSNTFLGCNAYMEKNDALIKEKEASFNENQYIIPILDKDGTSKLAVTTVTTIPFEYELGAKLNYKTTEKTFSEAEGKTFRSRNTDWTIKNVKAGSFTLTIEAQTDKDHTYDGFDMSNQENWTDEQLHEYLNIDNSINAEITLKDGTKISATGTSGGSNEPDGTSVSTWSLSYYNEESAAKLYALDANDIVSISCCGTELLG